MRPAAEDHRLAASQVGRRRREARRQRFDAGFAHAPGYDAADALAGEDPNTPVQRTTQGTYEFHDEHRLAEARRVEQISLTAAHERRKQVHDLDLRFEDAACADRLMQHRRGQRGCRGIPRPAVQACR